jgi:predicted kinase
MLTLTLMQGIPGCGKSRYLKRLAPAWLCSADSYPGLYEWDAATSSNKRDDTRIGKAHIFCFKQALQALQSGTSVIVDNTNLTVAALAPYIMLGGAFEAKIRIVRIECDQAKAFERQQHGCPLGTHRKMALRFERFKLPNHWTNVQIKTVQAK